MKKLSVNKNDCSFENKMLFKDILNRVKALGGSLIKNSKQTCVVAAMIGVVLISATNIYKTGRDIIHAVDYYTSIAKVDDTIESENSERINQLLNSAIVVANISTKAEMDYHFEDNNILDSEGNIVSLEGIDVPIYLVKCNLNDIAFQNMKLADSKTKAISLDYSSIDNGFTNYLPETVEELSLNGCNYITNLNDLPKRCPNLKAISISSNASLTDLSFIYNLPNLEQLFLTDSAYVTEDLLEYLHSHNISTNLNEQDIANAKKVDEIINRIITPGMTDSEKIQAVCLYILNNVEYDVHQTMESNVSPLACVLEDGKGVCASYAYFTNVLLNKAGIKAFEVTNDSHGWNVLELDGKYYYVDTTNMDGSMFYNFILKSINMTKYYMVDTNNTFSTAMDKPSDDTTIIPLSLIEDIQAGRDEKSIWEKYGGQVGNLGVALASFLAGVSVIVGPLMLMPTIEETLFLYDDIAYDYYRERKNQQRSK